MLSKNSKATLVKQLWGILSRSSKSQNALRGQLQRHPSKGPTLGHVFGVRCDHDRLEDSIRTLLTIKHNSTPQSFNAIMRKTLGFSTVIKNSTVAGAGRGLFIEGKVAGGSLVSIYPGAIFVPQDIDEDVYRVLTADTAVGYVVKRSDGYRVSGYYGHNSGGAYDYAVKHQGTWKCDKSDCKSCRVANDSWTSDPENAGIGLGEYANHPPKGILPNASFLETDFHGYDCFLWNSLPSIVGGSKEMIAAVSASSMDPTVRLVPGISIVALRDIEDEEVFVDYGYDPVVAPSWFTPVTYVGYDYSNGEE